MSTPVESRPRSHGSADDEHGRLFAVLSYVLPLIGGLVALLVDRGNPFSRGHAQQSIGALAALVLSFVAWAVVGYVIGLVPIIGPIVSISLFSLVIATAIFLLVNWIVSLLLAIGGRERQIPLANKITLRLFGDGSKPKSA